MEDVEPFVRATEIPPPMSKEDYASWLAEAWERLLAQRDSLPERAYHDFLEANPCMVPGFKGRPLESYRPGWHEQGPNASLFHNGPINWVMHSQPALEGYLHRIPDFMWVNTHSAGACAVLVEIERPNKRWFGQSGQTSRDLRQALDQIRDWKAWFEDLGHKEAFAKRYSVPAEYLRHFSFDVQYVLVYGSRSELMDDLELNRLRRHIAPDGVSMMSFDRLFPEMGAMDCISVRGRAGRDAVVAVPPTYRFMRYLLRAHSRFPELGEAISQNELMSLDRKTFLLSRLPYWRAWLRKNGAKVDFEVLPSTYKE